MTYKQKVGLGMELDAGELLHEEVTMETTYQL